MKSTKEESMALFWSWLSRAMHAFSKCSLVLPGTFEALFKTKCFTKLVQKDVKLDWIEEYNREYYDMVHAISSNPSCSIFAKFYTFVWAGQLCLTLWDTGCAVPTECRVVQLQTLLSDWLWQLNVLQPRIEVCSHKREALAASKVVSYLHFYLGGVPFNLFRPPDPGWFSSYDSTKMSTCEMGQWASAITIWHYTPSCILADKRWCSVTASHFSECWQSRNGKQSEMLWENWKSVLQR